MRDTLSAIERKYSKNFEKIKIHHELGECWKWDRKAGKNPRREIARLFRGKLGRYELVYKICCFPPCVNPEHFWIGRHGLTTWYQQDYDLWHRRKSTVDRMTGRKPREPITKKQRVVLRRSGLEQENYRLREEWKNIVS